MPDNPTSDPSNLDYKSLNGYVYCLRCRKRWCNDIALALTEMTDAALIWEHDPNQLPSDMLLEVPVFPTNNFFELVTLIPIDKQQRYDVTWRPDPVDMTWFSLGYLNPGESRRTIRELLIEQMWANWPEQLACNASHHNVTAEAIWQQETRPNNKNRFVQFWSVYRTGTCIYCKTHDPSSDPSLVPERQGSGTWSAAQPTHRAISSYNIGVERTKNELKELARLLEPKR